MTLQDFSALTAAVRAERPNPTGATIGERMLYGRIVMRICNAYQGARAFDAAAFRAACGVNAEEEG